MTSLLAEWDQREVAELARLLRKFADDALQFVRARTKPTGAERANS